MFSKHNQPWKPQLSSSMFICCPYDSNSYSSLSQNAEPVHFSVPEDTANEQYYVTLR